MLKYCYGNHAINDHCWLNKTSLVISSGNLLKFYEYQENRWLNTLILKPFNSIILKISYYPTNNNDNNINSGYLIVSGIQTLTTISLSNYEYNEFNCEFWLLNFIKFGDFIVAGMSDLSVLLLKFPELQIIESFPGKQFCLATSLAINVSTNDLDLVFNTIKSIHHFTLHKNIIAECSFTKSLHRGIVFKSKFIFSGKYFLTASEDRSVIIWSTPDFNVITVLEHPVKVWDGISIESQGKQIVVTCDSNGTIYFWNLKGKLLQTYSTRDPTPITNLSIFEDLISFGSQDGNLRIKSIDNQSNVMEFEIVENSVDWIKSICSFDDILYILTNNGHVYSIIDNKINKVSIPNYVTKISKNNEMDGYNEKICRKLSKLKIDLNSYRKGDVIPVNLLADRFKKTVNKFKGLMIRLQKFCSQDLTDISKDVDFISNVTCIGDDERFTSMIMERVDRLYDIFNTLEHIKLEIPKDTTFNGDIKSNGNEYTFKSSIINVCYDMIFIGDLNGQVHVFPISYTDSDTINIDYKVFKCFQYRVGNIYCSTNQDKYVVCVDNLGSIAIIDIDKLNSFDNYVYIKSYKLPFVKRYGKITSGLILSYCKCVILGDEFGNLYHGIVPNINRIKAHNDKITCIKYHDNNIFTSSTDGIISQWTLNFKKVNNIKIEHLQHIYNIIISDYIYVLGFIGTTAILYNLDGKVDLWSHDCGGPRRPLHLSNTNTYTKFAYAVDGILRIYTCHVETYSINPWFPYDDLYSGIWINDSILIGGRDCYIRLIQFPLDYNYLDCLSNNDVKITNPLTLPSRPIIVTKTRSFPCPIRCICKIDEFIVIGGAGIIKLYDNDLIELDSSIISDDNELLQIRVNSMTFIKCDYNILLICGISDSTLHIYKISRNPIVMIFVKRIILECTPLSIISNIDTIIVGTNKGFISKIKLVNDNIDNYTEKTNKIHQSGINGMIVLGKYIITCGDDQQLIVIDKITLEIKSITKVTNSIRCINCQDKYIFTAGWDLILRVWIIIENELKQLCKTTIITRPRSIILKNHYSESEKYINIAILGQKGSFEVFLFDKLSNEIIN